MLPNASAAPAPEAPDEDRPPYHWVGFGTVAIFAAWLPLAYVAGGVTRRLVAGRFGEGASADAIALAVSAMPSGERLALTATIALPALVALGIAAFGGGFVVGRFGPPAVGTREAALAGVSTALVANALAWSGLTLPALASALVTALVAVGLAAGGGRFGSRIRARA